MELLSSVVRSIPRSRPFCYDEGLILNSEGDVDETGCAAAVFHVNAVSGCVSEGSTVFVVAIVFEWCPYSICVCYPCYHVQTLGDWSDRTRAAEDVFRLLENLRKKSCTLVVRSIIRVSDLSLLVITATRNVGRSRGTRVVSLRSILLLERSAQVSLEVRRAEAMADFRGLIDGITVFVSVTEEDETGWPD